MNKKSFLAYIIVLVLVLCQSLIAQDGTEHFKQFSVSVGAGIPYSGLGANAEIYPIEYFGIDLGLGTYGRDVIGLIVGGRILILDQNSILRPFLSAHYGTIGQSKKKLITKKVNGYYDWSSAYAKPTGITGTAIGLGLRLRIPSLFQIMDVGVNLRRNFNLSSEEEEIKPWFGEFFVGIGYYL